MKLGCIAAFSYFLFSAIDFNTISHDKFYSPSILKRHLAQNNIFIMFGNVCICGQSFCSLPCKVKIKQLTPDLMSS